MRTFLPLLAFLAAAVPAYAADPPTIVHDRAALTRLRANSGLTLQWIWGAQRGHVAVTDRDGRWHLSGSQAGNGGRLTLAGDVVEIAGDRFTFQGRIVIADTPDPGRDCVRDGTYTFRVTQHRRYWRLQQMEACGDGLTDYVDIYF
jgi:hypothetical protein